MNNFYGEDAEPKEASKEDVSAPEGESFLAPTSALPDGCKVGNEYKFRVDGIYDSEAELVLVKDEKSDSEAKSESTPDSRMESMMEA